MPFIEWTSSYRVWQGLVLATCYIRGFSAWMILLFLITRAILGDLLSCPSWVIALAVILEFPSCGLLMVMELLMIFPRIIDEPDLEEWARFWRWRMTFLFVTAVIPCLFFPCIAFLIRLSSSSDGTSALKGAYVVSILAVFHVCAFTCFYYRFYSSRRYRDYEPIIWEPPESEFIEFSYTRDEDVEGPLQRAFESQQSEEDRPVSSTSCSNSMAEPVGFIVCCLFCTSLSRNSG
jgi:hypothetical protein